MLPSAWFDPPEIYTRLISNDVITRTSLVAIPTTLQPARHGDANLSWEALHTGSYCDNEQPQESVQMGAK